MLLIKVSFNACWFSFPNFTDWSQPDLQQGWLACLKQGNSLADASGWPSSLTVTLSRNQPQPPPRPSCPTRTLQTRPRHTASMRNSSCWRSEKESQG